MPNLAGKKQAKATATIRIRITIIKNVIGIQSARNNSQCLPTYHVLTVEAQLQKTPNNLSVLQ